VAQGNDLDRMVLACWREMRKGRDSCGVYQVEGNSAIKVYDLMRMENGRVDIWRRRELP
jgi:hypothetical protein